MQSKENSCITYKHTHFSARVTLTTIDISSTSGCKCKPVSRRAADAQSKTEKAETDLMWRQDTAVMAVGSRGLKSELEDV